MNAPRLSLFALMSSASLAIAQQQSTVVLQAHVTSASGRFVYLDIGRDAGVAPGEGAVPKEAEGHAGFRFD